MTHIDEFKVFKHEADQMGYFTGKEPVKEDDGSFTYTYKKEDWKFHDNFFGGEPYGGRVVIHYKNKPYWIMVYYGYIEDDVKNVNAIYSFLRKAVRKGAEEKSLERGPKKLVEGEYMYTNEWKGDIKNFSGIEHIYINNQHVFQTMYIGGLVDQRVGF